MTLRCGVQAILSIPRRFNPSTLQFQARSRSRWRDASMDRHLSTAHSRLIPQDSGIAQHPDDHRTLRKRIHLVGGERSIGCSVFHDRWASSLSVRTAHRAVGQKEHHYQQGGGAQRPASGVGFHGFSAMLKGVPPAARRVHQRGGGSAGVSGPALLVRAGRERGDEGGQQQAQRFARRAAGEEGGSEPASHIWPRFQSSILAWIATAMNTQRRVLR